MYLVHVLCVYMSTVNVVSVFVSVSVSVFVSVSDGCHFENEFG